MPQPQPNTLSSTEEVARARKSPIIEYGLDDVNSYERLDGHETLKNPLRLRKTPGILS